MKWIWVSLCGAAVGAAHSAPGWAADPPETAPAPQQRDAARFEAVGEPTQLHVGDLEAALLEADRRFVAGDLHGALDILEPACEASTRPECAFSLGAIHHGLGHCREARASYRRYREVAPTGEHMQEVTQALEEVETRCGNSDESAAAAPGPAPSNLEPRVMTPSKPAMLPAFDARVAGEAGAHAPPPLTPKPDSIRTELAVGSFALSGAAAATSVVFGVLAARSAGRCARADSYDRRYSEECEHRGPRYQGLWQGFALASGGFLGIGLTLWWLESDAAAPGGVSQGGVPAVRYQGRF